MEKWNLLGVLDALPQSLLSNLEMPKVTHRNKIPKYIIDNISRLDFTNKYVIKDDSIGTYFILENYSKDNYITYYLPKSYISSLKYSKLDENVPSDNKNSYANYYNIDVKELFKYWKQEPDYSSSLHSDNDTLNMVPPDKGTNDSKVVKNKLDDLSETIDTNPKDYLERKYYESLYSLKNPLAYFVKSNLVRFRNMCKEKYGGNFILNFQTIILNLILRIDIFDKRYNNNSTLLENSNLSSRYEKFARDKLLEEYSLLPTHSMKKRINEVATILKAREIKLQIILLLEMIHQNSLDGNFKEFEKNYKPKLMKRSLNLTKKSYIRKNRYTSKGKDSNINESHKTEQLTLSMDFCEQIDVYLDKLAILEILLETHLETTIKTDEEESIGNKLYQYQKNMLNKGQESSSLGFVIYVVIPYFNKVIPYTTKFIIKKLKGPSLRAKKPSGKRNTQLELDIINEPILRKMGSQSSSSERVFSANSLVHKNNMNNKSASKPRLSRHSSLVSSNLLQMSKTNSNLSDFLEVESNISKQTSFLIRTQSDLVMNNLQKRQLPISNFESTTKRQKPTINIKQEIDSSSTLLSTLKQDSQNIQTSFQRVGKRKPQAFNNFERQVSFYESSLCNVIENNSKEKTKKNTVEVMATPLKTSLSYRKAHTTILEIIESPAMNELDEHKPDMTHTASRVKDNSNSVKKDNITEFSSIPHYQFSSSYKKSPLSLVIESPSVFETPVQTKESDSKKNSNRNVRRRLFAP